MMAEDNEAIWMKENEGDNRLRPGSTCVYFGW